MTLALGFLQTTARQRSPAAGSPRFSQTAIVSRANCDFGPTPSDPRLLGLTLHGQAVLLNGSRLQLTGGEPARLGGR